MPDTPKASVIIVNWNGIAHLPTCLDSLAAQTLRDFETVIVDNGSIDGSVDLIRERYPWVRLLPLAENTGFAAGNNRGFKHARGKYLVTLNNDTYTEPAWLEVLCAVADAHPHAGMIGCRICSFDEPDRIDSLGLGICLDGMARGRFRNRYWSSLQMKEIDEILFPSACAALYRREMLDIIGGFDEDFFAYAEDSDLGLRGRLAGWGALLATGSVVRHKYSQTGGRFSPLKLYLVERNHYWVVLKSLPLRHLLPIPWFTLARYAQQLLQVLQRRGSGGEFASNPARWSLAMALLRGMWDAFRAVPRTLRKRRQVMRTRRISVQEITLLLHRYRISFDELLDNDTAADTGTALTRKGG